jgi:hypothetical protein
MEEAMAAIRRALTEEEAGEMTLIWPFLAADQSVPQIQCEAVVLLHSAPR